MSPLGTADSAMTLRRFLASLGVTYIHRDPSAPPLRFKVCLVGGLADSLRPRKPRHTELHIPPTDPSSQGRETEHLCHIRQQLIALDWEPSLDL